MRHGLRRMHGLALIVISELGMIRAFGRDVRWNLKDHRDYYDHR